MKFLRNSKEIKEYRDKQLIDQNQRDPILGIIIDNAVLDHDHENGKLRKVLDRDLNQFIGKLESNYKRFIRWKQVGSLSNILSAIADYLREDHTNIHHPNHLKVLLNRFNRMKKADKISLVWRMSNNQIIPSKDSKELLKQYKTLLLNEGN